MNCYNLIHDVKDVSSTSGVITEPVSLEEMKSYMRLEGSDMDTVETDAFIYDDDLIEQMITAARQRLENRLAISIIPRTVKVWITNLAGNQKLPYPPIGEIISVKDSDDNDISAEKYKLRGGDFKEIISPNNCDMTWEYYAGYVIAPEWVRTEIKRMVAYMYEHRGEEDQLNGFQYSVSNGMSRRSVLDDDVPPIN